MTIADSVTATPVVRLPGLAGLARVIARFRLARARRASLTHLSELPPYLLRDVGITPEQIAAALRGRI